MTSNFENVYSLDDQRDLFLGVTILVVDDDQNTRFLIKCILEDYGLQVLLASNAITALKLIKLHQVDLLISDIQMPQKDGYWLIKEVRSLSDAKKREMPAIAFSGDIGYQACEKALASGFQTYIPKFSSYTVLITEITKLVLGDTLLDEQPKVSQQRSSEDSSVKYILVCDDIAESCSYLKKVLEIEDYRIDAVTSGAEALAQIQAQKPDLLLLDVFMPDMDGTEVVRQIQLDPLLQSLPILLITAYSEALRNVKDSQLRVQGIIYKPIAPDVLTARVQEVL